MAHVKRVVFSLQTVGPSSFYLSTQKRLTDVHSAQSIMDPGLEDGVHNWRPGVKFRKDGYRVVIDGTDTLAGR
jgi:hypothetical protein